MGASLGIPALPNFRVFVFADWQEAHRSTRAQAGFAVQAARLFQAKIRISQSFATPVRCFITARLIKGF
jgi:hypothetical protein